MTRTAFIALIPWLALLGCSPAPADLPTTGADSGTTAVEPGSPALRNETSAPDAARAPTVTRPAAATPAPAPRPTFRDIVVPEGTSLHLELMSAVASDTSRPQDSVTASLTRPIAVNGVEVVPAGARVSGIVTDARESARVKGRASVAFRFTSVRIGERDYDLESAPISRLAQATKSEDATKIGIGAGAGAVIGGILGGKDGAAKGAAVGGGAGTGVVLATRGQEVRLGPGADITTTLAAPLTIRVPLS